MINKFINPTQYILPAAFQIVFIKKQLVVSQRCICLLINYNIRVSYCKLPMSYNIGIIENNWSFLSCFKKPEITPLEEIVENLEMKT